MKPLFHLLDGFLQGVCYINSTTALAFFLQREIEKAHFCLFCFFLLPLEYFYQLEIKKKIISGIKL